MPLNLLKRLFENVIVIASEKFLYFQDSEVIALPSDLL